MTRDLPMIDFPGPLSPSFPLPVPAEGQGEGFGLHSRPGRAALSSSASGERAALALDLGAVVLVLEQDAQRGTERRRVELFHAEAQERARPVESLGYRRRLMQFHRA